jgi:2-polyprenyl-3-methyl-5-hydroxy-6-metoxy-1,4-benzoquinol methylase
VTQEAARDRVASLFDSRFLQHYTRGKLARDPVYDAVIDRLRGSTLPLLDVGCGAGIFAFYLRECGLEMPLAGIDHDAKKIAAANAVASRYANVTFRQGDAREPLAHHGSVVMLDLLHYFDDATQSQILANAAAAVAPGGVLIVRDAIRDGSWRYRATYAQELFARSVRWLKAERLNFPAWTTLEALRGFSEEIVPMWGSTPFNNYLFVFRRESSGMTSE